MFQVTSDTQYLYDSNVLLTDGDFIQEADDAVFLQTFGVGFTPPLSAQLKTTLYWQHDLVRYDALSKFDFDDDLVGLRLGHPVKEWFTLYGGVSGGRYVFREGGEFLKFLDVQLGLARDEPLTRRLGLVYGYQFDARPSSPSELTRLDNALYAGLSLGVLERLTAQLAYRIRVRDYLQADRVDLDQLISFGLVYSFSNWASVRVSAGYARNNSSSNDFDYQAFTAGGAFNLTLRF